MSESCAIKTRAAIITCIHCIVVAVAHPSDTFFLGPAFSHPAYLLMIIIIIVGLTKPQS